MYCMEILCVFFAEYVYWIDSIIFYWLSVDCLSDSTCKSVELLHFLVNLNTCFDICSTSYHSQRFSFTRSNVWHIISTYGSSSGRSKSNLSHSQYISWKYWYTSSRSFLILISHSLVVRLCGGISHCIFFTHSSSADIVKMYLAIIILYK